MHIIYVCVLGGKKQQLSSSWCSGHRIEPLLARIKEDHRAILCPEIDLIDKDTLQYGGTGSFSVGGFWWSLHFSWRPIPERERKRRAEHRDISVSPIRYHTACVLSSWSLHAATLSLVVSVFSVVRVYSSALGLLIFHQVLITPCVCLSKYSFIRHLLFAPLARVEAQLSLHVKAPNKK